QDPTTASRPDRIARSVGLLVTHGAEIMAAPMETPSGFVRAREPGRAYRRYVPASTLVLRRASLIDMGGMAAGREDLDAELIFRAAREGRRFVLASEPTVESSGAPSRARLGPAPSFEFRDRSLRHHALGFPEERVESDVVLPFYGSLHFLRQSLPGLLEQEGAEAVIHLIDDGTPGGAEDVLRYWATHPRVRTYRNVRNIRQFSSFNAVASYFETRLVAVQDADDVSDPHRLRWSGNLIRLADAEIFGGGVRLFRDRPGAGEEGGPTGPRSDDSWCSTL